jgi:hypothetical protein
MGGSIGVIVIFDGGRLTEENHLENPGVEGRIKLKWRQGVN